jgi:protein SCO1/2
MLWVGLLLIGVLLVAIAFTLNLREQRALASIPPTLAPDIPGALPLEEARALTDFTLPATTGGPLSLSDWRGRWVLVFFGFTHCPDFCPLTMAKFKGVQAELEARGVGVPLTYAMISVDPARDTPDVLRDYLARFDPTFVGLSGDQAVLASIAEEYGLFWQLNTAQGENYTVDHSTSSYLIDPDGRLRVVYTFDASAANMALSIDEVTSQYQAAQMGA